MTFHGLFVGIDRYASPWVNWLSYARRDAAALHALFTDTLGGETVLLTDSQATGSAIKLEFERLAGCAEDDVVVVAYSGHGSDTHELVPYDADPTNPRDTCIPLETLLEWFTAIPARCLVCILDCCFSGGMGAKVLHMQTRARGMLSTDRLLDQLSGEGRLILTASRADEEALEDSSLRHGLLTYYLLEALQGAEEVQQAGKIAIYRLLEYVTRRVTTAATWFGHPQHPTLRGQIDRELTWPVFLPGDRYRAAFPERHRQPASSDVQSLLSFGFPPDLLAAWSSAIPSLNPLQIDAINSFGLLDGEHVVVSAPTSSGKTLVGELAALNGVLEQRRAFFLFPLKALVNDKHQHFVRTYTAFGVRTIRATGEITDDIPDLMRGRYDVCLMTYEKFARLVLGNPHLLNQVGTVVIDEVQMIADPTRGVNLEYVLTLLRMRRREGVEPQLIALSAVIGETNGLEQWLGARLLRRNERPVPLDEGVLRGDGSFRYVDPDRNEQLIPVYIQREPRKGSSQDWVIPLVRRLMAEGKQVIVFRETRGDARGCARYLAGTLGLPPAESVLAALPTGDSSIASDALRQALQGGVAFHISDLDREERLIIEEAFRAPQSPIRVIAATTTLAMGVNTPAEAVVIVGLDHPNGPYTVAEYKNIVGRAGRLGFAERGTSFLLALTPREESVVWDRYVRGDPEDMVSQFLAEGTDPRSLIIRVLASVPRLARRGMSDDEMVAFLEGSLGAFQQVQQTQHWTWDRAQLLDILSDLGSHRLIKEAPDAGWHLTPLGRVAGEAGVEVESIIRLVDALGTLAPEVITDPTLLVATQLTCELDHVLFPLNKASTQKEPQTWLSELQRQSVPASLLRILQQRVTAQHQATLRAKRAVACLLWITGRSLSEMERILTRFGGGLDGAAGPIRNVSARTCDLLPVVGRVIALLHPELDLAERVRRLLVRLELGLPAAAIDVAAQAGSRLSRGDYQLLLKAGLCTVEAIEQSDDDALLACLGGSQTKLEEARRAVQAHRQKESNAVPVTPILPEYEG